jgi:hypothetical protein
MRLQTAYQELFEMRATLGESPRDARIRDLIDRTIKCGLAFTVISKRLNELETESFDAFTPSFPG